MSRGHPFASGRQSRRQVYIDPPHIYDQKKLRREKASRFWRVWRSLAKGTRDGACHLLHEELAKEDDGFFSISSDPKQSIHKIVGKLQRGRECLGKLCTSECPIVPNNTINATDFDNTSLCAHHNRIMGFGLTPNSAFPGVTFDHYFHNGAGGIQCNCQATECFVTFDKIVDFLESRNVWTDKAQQNRNTHRSSNFNTRVSDVRDVRSGNDRHHPRSSDGKSTQNVHRPHAQGATYRSYNLPSFAIPPPVINCHPGGVMPPLPPPSHSSVQGFQESRKPKRQFTKLHTSSGLQEVREPTIVRTLHTSPLKRPRSPSRSSAPAVSAVDQSSVPDTEPARETEKRRKTSRSRSPRARSRTHSRSKSRSRSTSPRVRRNKSRSRDRRSPSQEKRSPSKNDRSPSPEKRRSPSPEKRRSPTPEKRRSPTKERTGSPRRRDRSYSRDRTPPRAHSASRARSPPRPSHSSSISDIWKSDLSELQNPPSYDFAVPIGVPVGKWKQLRGENMLVETSTHGTLSYNGQKFAIMMIARLLE